MKQFKTKRFGFFNRKNTFKKLENLLQKYQHIIHEYRFLKFFKKKMIFVGNIRNVKVVHLIPYNTKRGYFWFNKYYYPFNIIKEMRRNIVARFVPAIMIYFFLVTFLLSLTLFISFSQIGLTLSLYLIMAIVLPIAFFGLGSSNNVASSDANLKYAFEMLENADATYRNRIGFIFCDTTERQTTMTMINEFFKKHNKKPLLVEVAFYSGGENLYVAGTKNESKLLVNFAKKNKLDSYILPLIPEYYAYNKYLILSYTNQKDKDNEAYLKYTLNTKEVLDESQYEYLKSILSNLEND